MRLPQTSLSNTRQRSRESVVRRNGCPKGCFWRVPFFSAPLKDFEGLSGILRADLKGAENKRTLQKHPFGQPFRRTMPSPLLWRALNLVRDIWGDKGYLGDLRATFFVRKMFWEKVNRGVSQTGGCPAFFGEGPDCVADPFGTVPRRCS